MCVCVHVCLCVCVCVCVCERERWERETMRERERERESREREREDGKRKKSFDWINKYPCISYFSKFRQSFISSVSCCRRHRRRKSLCASGTLMTISSATTSGSTRISSMPNSESSLSKISDTSKKPRGLIIDFPQKLTMVHRLFAKASD